MLVDESELVTFLSDLSDRSVNLYFDDDHFCNSVSYVGDKQKEAIKKMNEQDIPSDVEMMQPKKKIDEKQWNLSTKTDIKSNKYYDCSKCIKSIRVDGRSKH